MPQVSSIREVDLALLTHFRNVLPLASPELFPPAEADFRILISPAADVGSDFRRLEEVARKKNNEGRIILPSFVFDRAPILELYRQYSKRERFGIDAVVNSSTARVTRAMRAKTEYQGRAYFFNYEDLLAFIEVWLLVVGDIRTFSYFSAYLQKDLDVNLIFETPTISLVPDRDSRWGGPGHVYSVETPFSIESVIALAPEVEKLIVKYTYTIANIENTMTLETRRVTSELGADLATGVDSSMVSRQIVLDDSCSSTDSYDSQ